MALSKMLSNLSCIKWFSNEKKENRENKNIEEKELRARVQSAAIAEFDERKKPKKDDDTDKAAGEKDEAAPSGAVEADKSISKKRTTDCGKRSGDKPTKKGKDEAAEVTGGMWKAIKELFLGTPEENELRQVLIRMKAEQPKYYVPLERSMRRKQEEEQEMEDRRKRKKMAERRRWNEIQEAEQEMEERRKRKEEQMMAERRRWNEIQEAAEIRRRRSFQPLATGYFDNLHVLYSNGVYSARNEINEMADARRVVRGNKYDQPSDCGLQ